MLTADQHARLPELAKAIVDADRALADLRAAPVAVLDEAARERLRDRRNLRRAAEQRWGYALRTEGGPAHA